MATVKINALALIAAASISATDALPIVDADAGTPVTQKITMAMMRTALLQASVGSGWGASDYLALGTGAGPGSGMLRVAQGAIVADSPLLNSTVTWNNAGVTFAHMVVNITDTASGAASRIVRYQVNSTNVWTLAKDGTVFQALGLTIGAGGLVVTSGGISVAAGATSVKALISTSLVVNGATTLNGNAAHLSGVLTLGHSVTTSAVNGDIVLGFNQGLRSLNFAGTDTLFVIGSLGAANQLSMNANSQPIDFQNLSVATSAFTGTNGALPAQVRGYVNCTIQGIASKIPYYFA